MGLALMYLLTLALFFLGLYELGQNSATIDATSILLWAVGLPALPWIGLTIYVIVLSQYQEKVIAPRENAEQKRKWQTENEVRKAERLRLIAFKDKLVEGDDFIWGTVPIVKCANGHKYRYSEFRFVSGSKSNTNYDEVTTRTEGKVSAVYSGGHIYPIAQGGSSSTSYIHRTTKTPIYTVGCPLCRTSIYTFEPPFDTSLITDYVFCRGEECFDALLDAPFLPSDDAAMWEVAGLMREKYGRSEGAAGHWNGSEFVPVFHRKKFKRCPLNTCPDDDVLHRHLERLQRL